MMNQSRKVKISTRLRLITKRPNLALSGFLFIIIPSFIIVIIYWINSFNNRDLPVVNYEQIYMYGTSTQGTILDIIPQYNESVNGQHPVIIKYTYKKGGKEIESKVKTLSLSKLVQLRIGEKVQARYLNAHSILVGIEPYSFPIKYLYLFLIPFYIFASPFLIILFRQVRMELNLYKHGIIKEGKLKALIPYFGRRKAGFGKSIEVRYRYKTSSGKYGHGKSITTDFSILNDKIAGDTIKIFVSGDDESKSCMVPEKEAVRNNWKI